MIRQNYLPFGKPNFSEDEISAVTQVLRSGWVGMGPETLAFEKELGKHLGAPHIVTVNSCTAALFLSLLVNNINPGDEVICPSLTWCSTANVALYLGAKPVFCDIDRDTLCLTPETVLEKLTPKTKAVMVVHFGGLAVEVGKIRAVLPDKVIVVEDAAHALGAKFKNGQFVGTSTNLTCFSFYANKNISTGDGGAVVCFDPNIRERIASLRQHGLPVNAWKRFSHPKTVIISPELSELGYKMNYTDLQASIGRVQLKRQKSFNLTRLSIANYYHEKLSSLGAKIEFQSNILHPYHARHLFTILLNDGVFSRDKILWELRKRNVGATIHYSPLHSMPLYEQQHQVLPNTEKIYKQIITLPIGASMSLEDAEYVVQQFEEVLQKY